MGKQITISVIVPTYNGVETIALCLAALQKQSRRPLEVIVVDNGSHDSTQEQVRELAKDFPCDLRLIEEPKRGAAAARNCGVRAAAGEWIAFIDADCEADVDWIKAGETLVSEIYPDALAGPAWGTMQGGLSAKLLGLTTLSVGLEEHWRDSSGETGVNGFATANFWIQKELFEALNGFDESLAVSGEDYDLCARVYEQGKRILYSPKLSVRHHHLSGISDLFQKALRYGRAHGMLFQRYGQPGLYFDLSNSRKSLSMNKRIWINLVSAEKKTAILVLLSFIWPGFLLLLALYPLVMARYLRTRARKSNVELGWLEGYCMGGLMILRSLAFTIGRIQGSSKNVWVA